MKNVWIQYRYKDPRYKRHPWNNWTDAGTFDNPELAKAIIQKRYDNNVKMVEFHTLETFTEDDSTAEGFKLGTIVNFGMYTFEGDLYLFRILGWCVADWKVGLNDVK